MHDARSVLFSISTKRLFAGGLALLILPFVLSAKQEKPKVFPTPEAAVQALVDAARKGDPVEVAKVLGPSGQRLLESGDDVADKLAAERFLSSYDERHAVVKGTLTVAELVTGRENWPFPIPIVKGAKGWSFDTEAGVQEILSRRIGRNELDTLGVMEAFVQAQREYYALDFDQDALLEYAQKFRSSDGKRDGLYWPVPEGQVPSPLGPLVGRAAAEGYSKREGGAPIPYHGYLYRILTAQGQAAPGGAFSYIINGNMVAGYAMVAWPVQYGSSGIMTFIVCANGVIFEKDLGEKTGDLASAMTTYDPDDSWRRAK